MSLVISLIIFFSAQFAFDSHVEVDSNVILVYSGKAGKRNVQIEIPQSALKGHDSVFHGIVRHGTDALFSDIDLKFDFHDSGVVVSQRRSEHCDDGVCNPGIRIDSLFFGKSHCNWSRIDGVWKYGSKSDVSDFVHFSLLAVKVRMESFRGFKCLRWNRFRGVDTNFLFSACGGRGKFAEYEYVGLVDERFASMNEYLIPEFDSDSNRELSRESAVVSKINDSTVKILYTALKGNSLPKISEGEWSPLLEDPRSSWILTYRTKYLLWRHGRTSIYSLRDLIKGNAKCKEKIDSVRTLRGGKSAYVYDVTEDGYETSYLGAYPQVRFTVADENAATVCGLKEILGM